MARPGPKGKYVPETVKKITEALGAGNTRGASSAYGGIDQSTFDRWMAKYAEFAAAVKDAEARAEVGHVANIAQAARSGNWTASAWWLERRRHQDWGRKDRVEIVNTVRQLAAAEGLTEEETAAAVAEAEAYLKGFRSGSRG
jgi:threonine synthase